ncbi:MAG: hypothetical protein PVH84_09815 [Candidatus Aminicenantes bacterium]|jgi:hypothetical protein
MKFMKISFLLIFVATLFIFVYCGSDAQKQEESMKPEQLPPLTPVEKARARRDVQKKFETGYDTIMRFFNNTDIPAETRRIRIEAEYEQFVQTGGTVQLTTSENEIIEGPEAVTNYLMGKWNENNALKLHIVLVSLIYTDLPNSDEPADPDENDMLVEVANDYHLIESNHNETDREDTDRYHRRLCDW